MTTPLTQRGIWSSDHDTKPGKRYLEALKKVKSAKSYQSLEADVYNHLHTFFSRYWQDDDFISKRRYSKNERYAIPYNGEEVLSLLGQP